MELVGVRVQMPTNAPVLLLRETTGENRLIPIFIGGPEAHAIDLALGEAQPPRPMTHDLFVTVIETLDAQLQQVTITEVREGTFYAEMTLKRTTGDSVMISARPSDAVALASRVGAPIFASEDLVDEVGVDSGDDGDEAVEEEMVEELRRFLESATPDDFTGDES